MDPTRINLINDAKNNVSKYMKKYSAVENSQETANPVNFGTQSSNQPENINQKTNKTPIVEKSNLELSQNNFTDTVNIMIMERNTLQMKLMTSTKQIDLLNTKNKELESRKSDFELQIKELTLKGNNLKSENENLKTKLNQIKEQNDFLQQTLSKNEEKINRLEKEEIERNQKLKNKIDECLDLNKTVKQLNDNINDLKKSNKKNVNDENLSERCLKLIQKNQFLLQEIEIKNKDIYSLNESLQKLEIKNKELETDIGDNEKIAKETQQNQVIEINKLKENNKTIFVELQTLKNKSSEVNKNLPRVNEELRAVIEQKNIIITDLLRKSERVDKLNDDCRTLLQKVQSDRDTISRCTEQNLQLKNTLFDQDKVIKTLQNEKASYLSTITKINEANQKSLNIDANSLYEYQAQVSSIHEAACALFKLNQQYSYNYRRFNLGTDFLTLSSTHLSLQDSMKDIIIKNEQLKKVNITLSETADEYCGVIKELNHSIVDLKEQLAFLKSNNDAKKIKPINETDDKKLKLIDFLNDEKSKLLVEIEELKQRMSENTCHQTIDKNGPLKTESYATLERRYNQIKHEKSIVESNLEELEHTNILLSQECDTITDYVTLYVNKKLGLKIIMEKCFQYIETLRKDSIYLFNSIMVMDEIVKYGIAHNEVMSKKENLSKSIKNIHYTLRQFLSHITSSDIEASFLTSFKFSTPTNSLPWISYINP